MSDKTQNYGLTKPSPEEFYDINVSNENMDKIDEALKSLNDSLDGVSPEYVLEQNNHNEQKFWVGKKEEYDAIQVKDPNTTYTVTDEDDTGVSDIVSMIYPIGSIYMSVVNTNPSTLFGGVWERLKDRFLLGASETYTVGKTGGEVEVQLTESEMPEHSHLLSPYVENTATGYSYTPPSDVWVAIQPNSNLKQGGKEYKVSNPPAGSSYEVGGNLPHNNMPPYLAVYMWKRTA